MSHYTYNEFHLGDNIVHLHFLRAIAEAHPEHCFIHAVHECHIKQLDEVIDDVGNILLITLEQRDKYAPPHCWHNTWKNADNFWERHPLRHDWVGFHLSWFAYLSHKMGLRCPMNDAKDFLFDYPALLAEGHRETEHLTPALSPSDAEREKEFDFLIINSQPCSGQLKPYDGPYYFEPLVMALLAKGYRVLTTDPVPGVTGGSTRGLGLSITGVGTISRRCKHIIAVATGPLWPCLNIWNTKTPIIILLDHVLGEENLSGLGENITQVKSREAVLEILKAKNLI